MDKPKPRRGGDRPAWPQAALDILYRDWNSGCSASQIAEHVCNEAGFHVTRNAVLGMRFRLRLTGRTKASSSPRAPRQRAPRLGKKALKAQLIRKFSTSGIFDVSSEVPGPYNVPLLETQAHHCRWIIGKRLDGGYLCCGEPIKADNPNKLSFCLRHCLHAYAEAGAVVDFEPQPPIEAAVPRRGFVQDNSFLIPREPRAGRDVATVSHPAPAFQSETARGPEAESGDAPDLDLVGEIGRQPHG